MEDLNPGNILGLYALDEEGLPVECPDVLEWGRWLEANHDKKRVALDELADGHWVSTVFLAIDHNHAGLFGDAEPALYETMVFNDYGSLDTDWACDRYATREQALDGHQHALTELRLHLKKKADHGQ